MLEILLNKKKRDNSYQIPGDAYTALLLKGDGPNDSTIITDSSTFNHSPTMNYADNVKVSAADAFAGDGALKFTYYPYSRLVFSSADLCPGTRDFTLEWRMKVSMSGGPSAPLVGWNDYYVALDGYIYTYDNVGNFLGSHVYNPSGPLADNIYRHYAISRRGGKTSAFIGGIKTLSEVNDNSSIGDALIFGLSPNDFGFGNFYGHHAGGDLVIDNLRLVINAGLYSDDFTPSAEIGLIEDM